MDHFVDDRRNQSGKKKLGKSLLGAEKMTTRISHGAHAWFKNLLDSVIRACPTCIIPSSPTKRQKTTGNDNSGFPSTRINLSPFTKDFRGGEHLNESID